VGAGLLAKAACQATSSFLTECLLIATPEPKSTTPLPPEVEAAQASASKAAHVSKAIRMMIGIGTPRKNSNIERMRLLLG
jgi:hypothetical protein